MLAETYPIQVLLMTLAGLVNRVLSKNRAVAIRPQLWFFSAGWIGAILAGTQRVGLR